MQLYWCSQKFTCFFFYFFFYRVFQKLEFNFWRPCLLSKQKKKLKFSCDDSFKVSFTIHTAFHMSTAFPNAILLNLIHFHYRSKNPYYTALILSIQILMCPKLIFLILNWLSVITKLQLKLFYQMSMMNQIHLDLCHYLIPVLMSTCLVVWKFSSQWFELI